jgi:pyruvate/2-oxoglutarate dehydrogenase complex dihydrolipoamide acyltransferase (E2) component
MMNKLIVPPFGELEEIKVLSWRHREGDHVDKGVLLVELEMDKAIIEVTAEAEGVLRKILCADGEWHRLGTPLAVLSTTPDEPLPASFDALAEIPAKYEAV